MYQNQRVQFNEAGLKEVAQDRGRPILPRDRHEIAGTDFRRHRQAGEIDRRGEKISAIPRSLSRPASWRAAGCSSRRSSCRKPFGKNCHEFANGATPMTFGAPHWFWALLAIPGARACSSPARSGAAPLRLREFVSERLLPQSRARPWIARRRDLRFALRAARARAGDHQPWPSRAGATPTKTRNAKGSTSSSRSIPRAACSRTTCRRTASSE